MLEWTGPYRERETFSRLRDFRQLYQYSHCYLKFFHLLSWNKSLHSHITVSSSGIQWFRERSLWSDKDEKPRQLLCVRFGSGVAFCVLRF